jgi:hypothetical protein
MCTNPTCKEALLCGESKCAKCEAHEVCPTVILSGFSKMLNERVGVFRDFAARMLQIEQTFFAKISQNRKRLMLELRLGGLGEQQYVAVFDKIYGKKAGTPLTGKEAREFLEQVKEERGISAGIVAGLLDGYNKEWKLQASQIMQLQENLVQGFPSNKPSVPPHFLNDLDSLIIRQEDKDRSKHLQLLK